MTDNKRESLVYNAKLAEQAERYDEMRQFMKTVATMGQQLSTEERNLLSVAYKNAVGTRRSSWRVISTVEERKRSKGQLHHAEAANAYKKKIENELQIICDEVLNILKLNLIEDVTSTESIVFYYKMVGDYNRYIAEFNDQIKEDVKKKALEAYKKATHIASNELLSTHPIRLGLALNFSVFYYEILEDSETACLMARNAFDDAIASLDSVSENSYRDSTVIMHLLRDNLTLWDPTEDAKNKDEKE